MAYYYDPEDRALLAEVKRSVPHDRCYSVEGGPPLAADAPEPKVCGSAILSGQATWLGSEPGREAFHSNLGGLFVDTKLDLDRFDAHFASHFDMPTYRASEVIVKVDMSPGLTFKQACDQLILERVSAGDDLRSWVLNDCVYATGYRGGAFEALIAGTGFQDPISLEIVATQLRSHPDLRFRLYIGGEDMNVPLETFAYERGLFNGHAALTIFPDAGHASDHVEVWTDLFPPQP